MEIRTDVFRPIDIGNTNTQRIQTSQNRQVQQPDLQVNQPTSARRDLINALTLMQTASGIVQEALAASSKLRAIAYSTIVSGNADYNEVAQTIAGIQSSLQQYGKPVVTPVITESQPNTHFAEIASNLDTLGAMAQKGSIEEKTLSDVDESFKKIDSNLQEGIGIAEKGLGLQKGKTTEETAHMLPLFPTEAIAAQGNIAQESAAALLR